MSESNVMSGKSLVEQAQLLADYIRSQATETPQNGRVIEDFFNEQINRIRNGELLKKRLECTPLAAVLATGEEREQILDTVVDRKDLKPLEPYINPKIFKEKRTEYLFNKRKRTSNADTALTLLTEILRVDGKDLSALDSGKKSNDELYVELSKIADNQHVYKEINKAPFLADLLNPKSDKTANKDTGAQR